MEKKFYRVKVVGDCKILRISMVVPTIMYNYKKLQVSDGSTKESTKLTTMTEVVRKMTKGKSDENKLMISPSDIELPQEVLETVVNWDIQAYEAYTTKRTRKRMGCNHHSFVMTVLLKCVKAIKTVDSGGGFCKLVSPMFKAFLSSDNEDKLEGE